MPSSQPPSRRQTIVSNGVILCLRGNSDGPSLRCCHLLPNTPPNLRKTSLHKLSRTQTPYMKHLRTYSHRKSSQPSKETMLKLLNNVQGSSGLRRSERLASRSNISRKPSSSGASGSQKRKSDHEERSSSKKARTQPVTLKRLSAMLQSALYAAERMSYAI